MTIKLTLWYDKNKSTYCININDDAIPEVEFNTVSNAAIWIDAFLRACKLTNTNVELINNL